jgi:hypothetical protein
MTVLDCAQLFAASYNGGHRELAALVTAGADVHWENDVRARARERLGLHVDPQLCVASDRTVQMGDFPLILATASGCTSTIARLVQLGADVRHHSECVL